jgi:hypothetical protein
MGLEENQWLHPKHVLVGDFVLARTLTRSLTVNICHRASMNGQKSTTSYSLFACLPSGIYFTGTLSRTILTDVKTHLDACNKYYLATLSVLDSSIDVRSKRNSSPKAQ